MTQFVRNWYQDDLWRKGFTFASTNVYAPEGNGRLCWNCGSFQPGDNSDEDWICSACDFQHWHKPEARIAQLEQRVLALERRWENEESYRREQMER